MSTAQFSIPVKNAEGKEVDTVSVDAARLDVRVRPALLKEAVVMHLANKRVGTHSTKTRSDVWASNKKPWRQKGTGRARAGTRRSPLWRGGGIVFGPHPRDYSYAIPRAQRRLALRSAFFSKVRDGQVVVLDALSVGGLVDARPKTKAIAQLLKSLGSPARCLIGTETMERNLVLSARNIPGVLVSPVTEFNTLDVLNARLVLLTRGGLERLLGAVGGEGGSQA